MAYNVKITEYVNGQLEVATYKQGVYEMLDGEASYRADMIDKNADALAWRFASYVVDEKTGQGRFIPRIDDAEYCYNPFTEKIQRVYTDVDEKFIERKKQHSIYSSLNRTRSALYMYARQCNWEYFITLTYSPDKIDNRYDFSLCMKKVHTWINNCKKRKAADLLYLLDSDYNSYDTLACVDKLKKSVDEGDMMSEEEILAMRGDMNPDNDAVTNRSKRLKRRMKKR